MPGETYHGMDVLQIGTDNARTPFSSPHLLQCLCCVCVAYRITLKKVKERCVMCDVKCVICNT